MNCIREAENYLKYYRQLKKSLEHADRMIVRLTWNTMPKEVGAAVLEATGIHADHPVNTLNQLYELQKWQEIKARTMIDLADVDNVLSSVENNYKTILTSFYVDKKTMFEISCETDYTERHLWRLKKKAINEFAVSLLGSQAMKAM